MFTEFFQKAGKMLMAGTLMAGLLASALSASAAATVHIRMGGSTTVDPISQMAMPWFSASYPDTDFPGYNGTWGSGGGQARLFAGQIDVAQSSSACSDGNKTITPTLYSCSDMVETAFAKDALSIVHKQGQDCVTQLTTQQVANIYMGRVTNWNQLAAGCGDHPIKAIARATTSGTRTSLIDMNKSGGKNGIATGSELTDAGEQAFIGAATRMQTSSDMEKAVATSDGWTIGYTGLGFVEPGVEAFAISNGPSGVNGGNGQGYVAPAVDTVLNGFYPYSRWLYYYNVKPSVMGGAYISRIGDYTTWMQGVFGQETVADQGFVPIGKAAKIYDVNGDGVIDIADVSIIGTYWGQTGAPGWVRADVNRDGVVDIADVSTVGTYWGATY